MLSKPGQAGRRFSDAQGFTAALCIRSIRISKGRSNWIVWIRFKWLELQAAQ
jgi:hypothetical protein